MLVPLPIGLWVFSFACDIVAFFVSNPATWKTVALYAGAASPGLFWLTLVAILLLLVSGWLGGKMVYRAGVAVDTETICSGQRG